MVTAILVKGLVPGGTDPILAISGYAGSGKTTTANYLRSLIDPFTKGKVLAKIPEIDHIAIHAKKRRILAIDNISHITADQSDTLL
jgi:ABC-type glutathione transport system ATPase component